MSICDINDDELREGIEAFEQVLIEDRHFKKAIFTRWTEAMDMVDLELSLNGRQQHITFQLKKYLDVFIHYPRNINTVVASDRNDIILGRNELLQEAINQIKSLHP